MANITDNYTAYNASSIATTAFMNSETYNDIWIAFDMINLAIRILGLITNPILLVKLSRHRVGSK